TPHRCGSATDRAARRHGCRTTERAAAPASPLSLDGRHELWQATGRRQGGRAHLTLDRRLALRVEEVEAAWRDGEADLGAGRDLGLCSDARDRDACRTDKH